MVDLIKINGTWRYDEPGFPYYCGDTTDLDASDEIAFEYTTPENELEELIDYDLCFDDIPFQHSEAVGDS